LHKHWLTDISTEKWSDETGDGQTDEWEKSVYKSLSIWLSQSVKSMVGNKQMNKQKPDRES
jgi:hypothetical protein